jgi:hemoglobin-like flavoprotein
MGCGASRPSREQSALVQSERLTISLHARAPSHDTLIRVWDTWRRIEEDLQGNGVYLFQEIFRLAPTARALFKLDHVSAATANLAESPAFCAHAKLVMSTLGNVVRRLYEEEEIESIALTLMKLGRRHAFKGVKPETYSVFHKALYQMLEHALGDKWDAEVVAAWGEAWHLISSCMLTAALSTADAQKNLPATAAAYIPDGDGVTHAVQAA